MTTVRRIVPVLLLLLLAAGGWLSNQPARPGEAEVERGETREALTAAEAFEGRRSEVWVEDEGTVVALLRDDLEGSRHQRFLVRLGTGSTLLVAHNIDLAPRVPLEKGDRVSVRGEYVWNEKGGLVHWTHRDPGGRRRGGWIRHGGREYR